MDDGSDQVEELTLEQVGGAALARARVLWAVLAVVGVAAGALVVISASDDDATRPALPVALGSSVTRAEGAAADSMLASVTYVASDDLPALGGAAPAYRLPGTVTEERVHALAEALGLAGDLVHDGPGWTVSGADGTLEVYEGGAAQWWYTPASGSLGGGSSGSTGSRAVVTTDTTTPECTASDGPAECLTGECVPGTDCALPPTTTTLACGPGADCVAPVPPDDPDCAVASDGSTTCPDPTATPADLPSEDEARDIALTLLAATGMDVDDAQVSVEGPFGAWRVAVEPRLDGVPSGLVADVTVGAAGTVQGASGYLAEPEALGDYPLLDTRAAIDRANEQAGAVPAVGTDTTEEVVITGTDPGTEDPCAGAEACDGMTGGVPSTTVPACKVQADGSEICEPVVPGITCPQVAAPADEPLGAPESVTCTPPVPDPGGVPAPVPGPIEILLVDAEPALLLLGAVDGSTDAYLVPGYRFTAEDGSVVDLAAVADSELTAPPTTDTSAPEPAPAPVEPQPCEVLVEGDASGTTHTIQPDPSCLVPEEPQVLEEGQSPEIGVGYYVDVQVEHCSYVELGGWFWTPIDVDPGSAGWAEPTEGGIFTLRSETEADFVGDAGKIKVGTFERISTDGIACA